MILEVLESLHLVFSLHLVSTTIAKKIYTLTNRFHDVMSKNMYATRIVPFICQKFYVIFCVDFLVIKFHQNSLYYCKKPEVHSGNLKIL